MLVSSRLDFFLVSQNVVFNVYKSEIGYGFKTDHSVVTLGIQTGSFDRGPGIWKLNTRHLDDREYVKAIENKIEKHSKLSPFMEASESCEALKNSVTEYSKQFSKTNALSQKIKKNKIKELIKEINKRWQSAPNLELYEVKQEIEKCYDEILEAETRKHIFLSKCK